MTLRATSSAIIIRNSVGQTKFNSSDKLLYLRSQHFGTYSMASNASNGWFVTPTISVNDFILMKIRFTSISGNGMPGYTYNWQNVNGSIIIHTVAGSQSSGTNIAQHVLNIGISNGAVILNKYYINSAKMPIVSDVSFTFEYKWYAFNAK